MYDLVQEAHLGTNLTTLGDQYEYAVGWRVSYRTPEVLWQRGFDLKHTARFT